jgi:hypothetical protein
MVKIPSRPTSQDFADVKQQEEALSLALGDTRADLIEMGILDNIYTLAEQNGWTEADIIAAMQQEGIDHLLQAD